MPKAPASSGKKIGGLSQRNAIILFVVVAVGVFFYMRHRSASAGTSTAAQPSTSADQSTPYPTPTSDSTGGASGSGSGSGVDALTGLLAQFTTNPPYYYYNTGGNTTTTYNYTPGSPMQTSPAAPPGAPNYGGPPGIEQIIPGSSIPGSFISPPFPTVGPEAPPSSFSIPRPGVPVAA